MTKTEVRLRALLMEYGRHKQTPWIDDEAEAIRPGCSIYDSPPDVVICDCGLWEALKELDVRAPVTLAKGEGADE